MQDWIHFFDDWNKIFTVKIINNTDINFDDNDNDINDFFLSLDSHLDKILYYIIKLYKIITCTY